MAARNFWSEGSILLRGRCAEQGVTTKFLVRILAASGRRDELVVNGHGGLDQAAIPAAALVWPMLALMEPMKAG